jgi:transposase-like protein
MLPISSIRTDGGTQPRATIDFSAVDDYMDAMLAGVTFPPVTVFYDGADYWLADGFHRCKAASQAGLEEIACDIRQGTQQDAQWYSFSANKTNGLRRTNEDKQRAVKAALGHPGGAGKSDSAIAKHVGVDVKTVGSWRDRLSMEIPKMDHRTVTRSGSTYQQNTTNIGRKPVEVREAKGITKVGASPAEDAVHRTFDLLEQSEIPVEEPYSIDAALAHIMLDIMTSPLHLRGELIRRLREALEAGR